MPTRQQVQALLDDGHSHAAAGRSLGIPAAQAFLIATGHAADTSDGSVPAQDLLPAPPHNPTRNDRVLAWVKERAARDLEPPS